MKHYQKYTVDMNTEVFRTIKGFSTYKVSNYGTIINANTGRVKKWIRNNANHYYVFLTPDGYKNYQKHKFVHRLVANAFMSNPDPINMDCINHIDEDPYNNRLDNLEFCDRAWNNQWGSFKAREIYTKRLLGKLKKVYAINKHTQEVTKFDSLADAAKFTGISREHIGQVVLNQTKHIGGDYVFCSPGQYTKKYAQKLIKNSEHHVYLSKEPIYAINVDTKAVFKFNSFKELGKELHLCYDYAYKYMKDPTLPNSYPYVFCLESQYSEPYIEYLLKVYVPKEKQAIPIVGMNIDTGDIKYFDSIKQAEHMLNNLSIGLYLKGKVKTAKNWVFCKKVEYTKELLQQKAKEAHPKQIPNIIILDCKTGETKEVNTNIPSLAKTYNISPNTIRNQLNNSTLSYLGQQFIYKKDFNESLKKSFMDRYKKCSRGKEVYAINIQTLKITKYSSVTEASKQLNISIARILGNIRHESNQTAGYAFCYETYYSKRYMYQLAYYGKAGKQGFPVSSVDTQGRQKFYATVKEASQDTGISRNNIFRVIRGERNTAGGYSWFKENLDSYLNYLLKN